MRAHPGLVVGAPLELGKSLGLRARRLVQLGHHLWRDQLVVCSRQEQARDGQPGHLHPRVVLVLVRPPRQSSDQLNVEQRLGHVGDAGERVLDDHAGNPGSILGSGTQIYGDSSS